MGVVGTNYHEVPLDVEDYLSYVPQTVGAQTDLTQAQFDDERANLPELNVLYNQLVADGFMLVTFSRVQMSTGEVVTQAVLVKEDLSAATTLMRQGDHAIAYTL